MSNRENVKASYQILKHHLKIIQHSIDSNSFNSINWETLEKEFLLYSKCLFREIEDLIN